MDDLISRQAAIDALGKDPMGGLNYESILGSLPSVQPEKRTETHAETHACDLISRRAAIDRFEPWLKVDGYSEGELNMLKAVLYELRVMPPAQQERKRGKWIPHSEKCREYIGTVLVNVEYDYWLCDACGYRVEKGQPMYNFCPNCGAKMEVDDGSD